MFESIYEKHGYDDRQDYLEALAIDNDVDIDIIMTLEDLMGPDEDFDGLVTSLQDWVS